MTALAIITNIIWTLALAVAFFAGRTKGHRDARAEFHRSRSAASTKAAATRRRNRTPSPLFVEGAVPTDSEGAE